MYDFIEKEEYLTPEESLKKYLYFTGEDELPKESWPAVQLPLEGFNVSDIHRNDFEELLRNSDLTEEQRKLYHSQFIKTKRIYKRQKAKLRYGGALPASYFEVLHEATIEDRIVEEHSTTKAQSDNLDKDEDQKRKKRMSAQISRDRKKLYIERMEQENKILRQRNSLLENENQGLKRQVQALRPKEKGLMKVDRSLKGIFIMSLILLTSVNKQLHKNDNHLNLNLSHESLLKHAAAILDEYNREEFTISLPQLEQFQREIEREASKDLIKEEVDSLFLKTEYSNKPKILLQNTSPKIDFFEEKADKKVRRPRKKQQAFEITHTVY